MYVTMTA